MSLWEIMREYKIDELALMLSALTNCSRDLNTADQLSKKICTQEFLEDLGHCLSGLVTVCSNFDADPSLIDQIKELEASIKNGTADLREAVLHAELKTILSGVHNNLEARKFMFIPPEDAPYWNNHKLFGDDFLITFPTDAMLELREACNCFVASRGTACVFHCMRVAEYGLRKLACLVKIKLADKGKLIPIEYGSWDKVIQAIKNKITDARKFPMGKKKEKTLQFYSSAADHCEYMKDIWRNELAHTRPRSYKREEALGVINRVKDFVQLIAKHECTPKRRDVLLTRKLDEIKSWIDQKKATNETDND